MLAKAVEQFEFALKLDPNAENAQIFLDVTKSKVSCFSDFYFS